MKILQSKWAIVLDESTGIPIYLAMRTKPIGTIKYFRVTMLDDHEIGQPETCYFIGKQYHSAMNPRVLVDNVPRSMIIL